MEEVTGEAHSVHHLMVYRRNHWERGTYQTIQIIQFISSSNYSKVDIKVYSPPKMIIIK